MRLLSTGPRALPPGARESGCSEGDSVRGTGAIREVGAPSRSAHQEPVIKKKRGRGEAAVRHDRRSGSPEVPCTPVLSPLDRGELPQPPLPPRTPREPERAESSRL
ncbi:hypothetical protein NDU88_004455 [Pleurodeles waltl]|uniref:Uncharacterized protein n=1 Tax=Pleurodeles waltl TaxID=8319 RepID=A0AAV7LJZ9_PLEWA|nr:hypothetical protein NDU88_004455 [Pleurodeles waltl]